MKRSRRLLMLVLPLALLLGGALAAAWIMHSDSGTRWLFTRLAGAVPGDLSAQQIEGDLSGGLRLSGLQYRDEDLRVTVQALHLSVNLDILPPALRLETLHGEGVDIQSLKQGDPGTSETAGLPDLTLPITVELADARIERARFLDPAGESLLELESLTARARARRALAVEELVVKSGGHTLALSADMELAEPHRLALSASTSGATALRLRAAGEPENLQLELSSQQPDVEVRGTVTGLPGDLRWDLTAESPVLSWPPGTDDAGWRFSSLAVQTTGGPDAYSLRLEGVAAAADFPATRVELAGAGNLESLDIEVLNLHGPALELSASGAARWTPEPALELETRLSRLDPRSWSADWPEDLPLNGRASLAWKTTTVRLEALELALQNHPVVLRGDGIFDLEAAVVDGRLSWSGLSWPPGSTAPGLRSDSGDLAVAGGPDDWRLSGNLSIAGADLPAADLRLSGHGDRRSARIELHDAAVLGGRIAGHGAFEWDGAMPFSASLQAQDIDTGILLPDVPGNLTGRLDLTGQASPLSLEADIQALRGMLRHTPVSARGGISWASKGAKFRARQLEVRSGAAFLLLDGDLQARAGLDFELDVDSLARFVAGTSGALRGHGRISLGADQPTLSATLDGSRLAAAGVAADRLELRPGPDGGSELALTGLQLGGQELESLSLRMPGRTPLQRVEISAVFGATRLDTVLSGGLVNWSDPWSAGWRGSLDQLRIDHEDQFELTLDQAAELGIGSGYFDLSAACLSGSRDTRLCLEGRWLGGRDAAISARLVAVPLGLVEPLLEQEVEFTQILNGQLDWNRTAGSRSNGAAAIDISPGSVLLEGDPEPILSTGPGHMGYQLVNGSLRQGRLSLQLPGSGELEVDFNVPDVSSGTESPVRGRVQIAMSDLAFLNRLQAIFDDVRGELDVDLSLAGTLAEPVFEGSAALHSGHLENRAYGLEFSEIDLAGRITPDNRSLLSGRFRSGDGEGQLNLDAGFRDMMSPELRLGLQGESLTIVDVPELRVVADPDITLLWQDRMLEVDGRLAVPSARLAPVYLPQASVLESRDVQIVAGELPHEAPEPVSNKPLRLRGELEVELGQDVVVDLDLARASVTGLTVFRWRDDPMPLASGNFDLAGEIQAYGQLLRISQGRISFPDTPANNPHLNIRAEREIFGNTQIRRAGLMVAGTARQPVIEAYTVPMTDKDRARTLLVTGSDFNYEQGVGAVGVGTYVLPRLYVSYGIGIFEDGNTISARYDLGRGFGVKATSGERETGVDLNYRFER